MKSKGKQELIDELQTILDILQEQEVDFFAFIDKDDSTIQGRVACSPMFISAALDHLMEKHPELAFLLLANQLSQLKKLDENTYKSIISHIESCWPEDQGAAQ